VSIFVNRLIIVNMELEVHQGTINFGVNEWEFIGLQVSDQMHSVFSIKVNLSQTLIVDDLWTDVI
jgi:hypothetical protein